MNKRRQWTVFGVFITLSCQVIECKKRSKAMVPQGEEQDGAIQYIPEGKKMPEVLDPYALANDPTAPDLFTDAFELPENKPNQALKKFLRKADDRAFRREMRLRYFGKSRHPNTENNLNTRKTEPDFTSVETHPDNVYIENKYTNLFIE
ncbi:hypothetical protein M8J75_010716 [Diaphorina citri]|nr:hypothetical protein M8J75_010716 [Diaphorina citri]KAI5732281.1 hypothetical protein M8J77_024251 [Diaphorina citri]